MTLYLFQSTLADFLRPRRLLVWVGLALVLFIMGRTILSVNPGSKPDAIYLLMSNIILYRIQMLAAAIFALQVIGAEVEQKTIVYLLTRPMPRAQILLARTMAAIASVAFISLISLVAVAAACGGTAWQQLPVDASALVAGAFAYTSFFALISLFIHKAMTLCLMFAFGWETGIPNLPGNLFWVSINSYLTGITQAAKREAANGAINAFAGGRSVGEITPVIGWCAMIGFTLFCLGLGAYWFSNNEYVAREDAE
jgi:ABC-2 type transport system permease protein